MNLVASDNNIETNNTKAKEIINQNQTAFLTFAVKQSMMTQSNQRIMKTITYEGNKRKIVILNITLKVRKVRKLSYNKKEEEKEQNCLKF